MLYGEAFDRPIRNSTQREIDVKKRRGNHEMRWEIVIVVDKEWSIACSSVESMVIKILIVTMIWIVLMLHLKTKHKFKYTMLLMNIVITTKNHIYIHTYKHTHMHTYIHTYIYIHYILINHCSTSSSSSSSMIIIIILLDVTLSGRLGSTPFCNSTSTILSRPL